MDPRELRSRSNEPHFHPERNPAGQPHPNQSPKHDPHPGLHQHHGIFDNLHKPKIDLSKAKAIAGLQRQGSTTSEGTGSPVFGSPLTSPGSWPGPQNNATIITATQHHKPALFKEFDFK